MRPSTTRGRRSPARVSSRQAQLWKGPCNTQGHETPGAAAMTSPKPVVPRCWWLRQFTRGVLGFPPSLVFARFLPRSLRHVGQFFGQVAPHRTHVTSFSRVSPKSRCHSGVPQEVRPVVPGMTGNPRLSLFWLVVQQSGRKVLFGLQAWGSEGAPVLISVGSSRVSSVTTCEAAGSLCVSSAFAQVNL